MLLRRPHLLRHHRRREVIGSSTEPSAEPVDEPTKGVDVDAIVVPALLALAARNLALFDPPRVLAWRWLHDERLGDAPAWLSAIAPTPVPSWDRDPIAASLAFLTLVAGAAYLALCLRRARARAKALVLVAASFLLVVVPTIAFIVLGVATGRPYGQDGGVVQLPLAMEKLARGESPYGADYSDSMLGKEARASGFWANLGPNPILHHHAYLPGTHLLMAPAFIVSRALGAPFDPRIVTLVAYGLAAWLASRLPVGANRRLVAAACVAVNPLLYWHQVFGANDVLALTLLLGVMLAIKTQRRTVGAVLLGLACATKQLAWPFAPFLLPALAGVSGASSLMAAGGLRSILKCGGVATGVFALVVGPVAALDPRAFWGDIFVYNAGLPGAVNYPLGGTPGLGFANFLIYFGFVRSLGEYFPFAFFYVALVPLGLLLLVRQWRLGELGVPLVAGSAALLASLYFSRVVHPNYLVLVAGALPIGVLACKRISADVAVVPLLLLASAGEIVGGEIYRAAWEDAVSAHVPEWTTGISRHLLPRAAPDLTLDPVGLGLAGLAVGLGLAYLVVSFLTRSIRGRVALVAVSAVTLVALPTLFLVGVGRGTGAVRARGGFIAAVALSEHTRVLEPWSRSFQRDPPGPIEANTEPMDLPLAARAARPLARWWASPSPVVDPRPIVLACFGVLFVLVWRRLPSSQVAWGLGALVASPFVVTGLPFGSAACVAVLLLAALFVPREVVRLPAALLAAPSGLLARAHLGPAPPVARGAFALACAAILTVLFFVRVRGGEIEPGIDWTTLVWYAGATVSPGIATLVFFVSVLAMLIAAGRARDGSTGLAWAALVLWVGLLLTPGQGPEAFAIPLALLVGACVSMRHSRVRAEPLSGQ